MRWEWSGKAIIHFKKGDVTTRRAEPIDELVESVAAGVTGGSLLHHGFKNSSGASASFVNRAFLIAPLNQ